METEDHSIKDILTISPNGLINSLRTKKDIDDLSVYFGYKNPEDEIVSIYSIIKLFIEILKSRMEK